MISRLRKVLGVAFMVLVMLAGISGWSANALSSLVYQGQHISSSHLLADGPNRITCPPPPYEC